MTDLISDGKEKMTGDDGCWYLGIRQLQQRWLHEYQEKRRERGELRHHRLENRTRKYMHKRETNTWNGVGEYYYLLVGVFGFWGGGEDMAIYSTVHTKKKGQLVKCLDRILGS